MSRFIENPYSHSELQEMFEKQRDKVPFETIKQVKNKDGEDWKLIIKGYFISEDYFDVWKDDYILSFQRERKNYGGSSPNNRFANFEDFKTAIFNSLKLEEEQQYEMLI